ncbi:spermatogenesis-associated protein 33 isoform X3 [Equus asinus]|uniref:spermatogenesis-associated protein 33 isoform X3 n=1 Tax=Equus asinus TaxID=9793 RepID=UPI001D0530BE|nr:spermatogenesis-associated protein 33 isoform X3 [Equus asinus]
MTVPLESSSTEIAVFRETERPKSCRLSYLSLDQSRRLKDGGIHCPKFETPDVKSSRKQVAVPQIVITRASKETLISYSSIRSEDQTTIQERADWGPYHRHRNPSTVDAYGPQIKEETGAPNRCRESLC